jgi:hypothetical protein
MKNCRFFCSVLGAGAIYVIGAAVSAVEDAIVIGSFVLLVIMVMAALFFVIIPALAGILAVEGFDLLQLPVFESLDKLLQVAGVGGIDPETAHVHGLMNGIADGVYDDGLQLSSLEGGKGIAALLRSLGIAVFDCFNIAAFTVDDKKQGRGGKVIEELTVEAVIYCDGKTDFHFFHSPFFWG